MDKADVLLVHAGPDDPDAHLASWIVRRRMILDGRKVVSQESWPSPLPPSGWQASGADVYFFRPDCGRQQVGRLAAQARSVTLFGPHKGSADLLQNTDFPQNVQVLNDGGLALCELAWRSFGQGKPPWTVDYVADRARNDLELKLPYSREINAALRSYPLDYETWDKLSAAVKDPLTDGLDLVVQGTALLRGEDQMVRQILRNLRGFILAGVLGVSCNTPVLVPETAARLARQARFGMAWFRRSNGKYQLELRSDPENPDALDVGETVRALGWDGGRHAARIVLDEAPGDSWPRGNGFVVVKDRTP